ncbi:uncharacterized protein LOC144431336 [Styela clava]
MMEKCINGKILKEEIDSWQSDDDEEYLPDSDSDDEEESVSSVKGVRIKTEPVSEEEYEDLLEDETTSSSSTAIQKRHSLHQLEVVIQSHRPRKARPNPQEENGYIWTKSFSGRDIRPFGGQQKVCSKELGQRSTLLDCFSQFWFYRIKYENMVT